MYGGVSAALTAAVVFNALLERPQFFAAAVHLTRSSGSLMVCVWCVK